MLTIFSAYLSNWHPSISNADLKTIFAKQKVDLLFMTRIGEAYQLCIVPMSCDYYNEIVPFLFNMEGDIEAPDIFFELGMC